MGTDIDVRVLKGKKGRNVFTNFGEPLRRATTSRGVYTRGMPLSLPFSPLGSFTPLSDWHLAVETERTRRGSSSAVGMQN